MQDELRKGESKEQNTKREKKKCRTYLKKLLKNLSQGYYRTELYLEG